MYKNLCRSTLLLILIVNVCFGCFLNSCPYRRYGRSPLSCGQCGENLAGLCVSNSVCCTSKACFESEECNNSEVCPVPQCSLGGLAGECVNDQLCCVRRVCQQNLQCLTGQNRPKLR
ncbi:hypothetical protein M3Y95_00029300 [Aphelenchoides besseyi]|nr:hypothetical protein M3Y95_00029300 [Aphelenchoides besseyi]